MGRYFLQQRNKLEKNEQLTPEKVSAINGFIKSESVKFFTEFGLDLRNPDAYKDEPNKTPQVFLLKDGKVSTLTDNNIKPGSKEFWEAAMMGQLFGYQRGQKNPVQIQAWMGTGGLNCEFSEPLEPGKEPKFPNEPGEVKYHNDPQMPTKPKEPEKPRPVAKPGQEPAAPNFFTRLGALFGSKASRDKIAMHTAWTDQTAAYNKYQADLKAYPEKLEEYQDDLRSYAQRMSAYYGLKVQKDLKNAGAEGRMETYRLEHAAWEKENANRNALSAERNKSALAIAAALGKTRGDDVLKNENAEKKVQQKIFSLATDQIYAEHGIENMMSVFGSKPHAREDFIRDGRYRASDIKNLSQIDLDGLTLGEGQGKQITDEEFGALSMFAVITPENGKALSMESNPPVVDYDGTVKAFAELGYSEQELNEVLANQFVGVVTTDMFRHDSPRNPIATYLKAYVEPARQNAAKALEEYKKGNKQPLADIISRGMEYTDQTARVSNSIDECTNGALQMASHLVDMMERDPQLKEMAAASFEERENAMCERHKEFAAPRTMNDLIQNVKGHEKMREVRQVATAAQEKLLNDRAGKVTLSEQEKKDCLRDVLKGEFIDSLYATQTNIFDKKAVQKMEPLTNAVQKYETDPKLSMLPSTIDVILQTRYVERETKDNPSVLNTFNRPAFMKATDKNLDKLIDQEVEKGVSLDKMFDKILDNADKTYQGKSLLESMNKAEKGTPDKVIETEKTKSIVNQQEKKVDTGEVEATR